MDTMTNIQPTMQPIVADETERVALRKLASLLGDLPGTCEQGQVHIVTPQGDEAVLPLSVCKGVAQLVHYLISDQVVFLTPLGKDLTTQQAADLLNVSRPYLVRLLEAGKIPYTKVGTHRRLRYADVIAYKQQRDVDRDQALARLQQRSQDLGLYD